MQHRRIEPAPGQESVWDYPRPAICEPTSRHLRIEVDGVTVADTRSAFRVLETSHPPVYYFPPGDVRLELLEPSDRHTVCEWKGVAKYFSLRLPSRVIDDAAWAYPRPTSNFLPMRGFLAFFPQKMDACYVDGEQAEPQPGSFYAGWITPDVVGPFKGIPGSNFW